MPGGGGGGGGGWGGGGGTVGLRHSRTLLAISFTE